MHLKAYTNIVAGLLVFSSPNTVIAVDKKKVSNTCDILPLMRPEKPLSSIGVFKKLGVDLSRVRTKSMLVKSEPGQVFYRNFVIRSVDFGDLTIEIANFETHFGIAPEVRNEAQSRGAWTSKIEAAYDVHNEKELSFLDWMQFQRAITEDLNVFAKLSTLSIELQNSSDNEVASYISQLAQFIDKQEQRRGWSQAMYEQLVPISKRFAGSTTNLVIRDRKTQAIVTSLRMVRAPFGGATFLERTERGIEPKTEVGSWGPLYKRLAAPNPRMMFEDDFMLFAEQAPIRARNQLFTTKLPHEDYVPEQYRLRRETMEGFIYQPIQHANHYLRRAIFAYFWQKELIEPSGFAVNKKYLNSANARSAVLLLSLGFLLEPDSLRFIEPTDQYFVFPNDKVGVDLYRRFHFKPVSSAFGIFGMKNWYLLGAERNEFKSALEEILGGTAEQIDAIAKDFFSKF